MKTSGEISKVSQIMKALGGGFLLTMAGILTLVILVFLYKIAGSFMVGFAVSWALVSWIIYMIGRF